MNSIHRSILARSFMTSAASLALLMTGAAEGRAESVFVQGANGANFIYGNPDVPATDGGSATATAGSMQPVTDPYNSAYAVGGNGGQGVRATSSVKGVGAGAATRARRRRRP